MPNRHFRSSHFSCPSKQSKRDVYIDSKNSTDFSVSPVSGSQAESAAAYAKTGDQPERSFAELGVPNPLVRVLSKDGKTTAFPIQAATLEDSLNGRDILGRGETGSGKTLAFAIPLVARLGEGDVPLEQDSSEDLDGGSDAHSGRDAKRGSGRGGSRRRGGSMPHPRGLILAPTRELVNQIDEVVAPLAAAYGMHATTVYGGVKYSRQIADLNAGADIVLACPGRLEDLLEQGVLSLESVGISVLDEADEMADMGFLPAVERLLEQVDHSGQRMLFSATLDHGVDKVVKRFLHDPVVHEIAPADAQVGTMTHHIFGVSQGNKYEVIRQLASGRGRRILFTRTKFQAKKMADKLVKAGIPAVDLQGNLSQNQRDRHLAAFTSGEVRVLVATDVAARGIDVSDVELVVQTEPPEDPKSFLHRSGRTARAGQSGDVVTLVLPNQRREARQMLRSAGLEVKSVDVVPGCDEIMDLVGQPAPLVEGWSLPTPSAARGGKRGGRSSRGREGSRRGRSGRDTSADGRGRSGHDRHDRRDERGGFEGDERRGRRDGGSSRVGGRQGNPRYEDDGAGPIEARSGYGRGDRDVRFGHEGNGYHDGKRRRSGNRDRAWDDRSNPRRNDRRSGGHSRGSRFDRDSYSYGDSERDSYQSRGSGRSGKSRGDGFDRRTRKADGFRRSRSRRNSAPFSKGR
ncbi:Superfamily II DNA and RNA helicase [Bifidobacterium bohemicum]|uniref:DEAD/DEAH box helicase domain protein n=1 Tax=Bifidobacterium bohemicum DSM 22767 TaxID=1437606 RepID=A0A086ZKC2_9BIFI|nr:DEAD/DEAH box helicase domain protein [Bifidobacterium bohemicum DSM 22767]SCB86614.1 Superfamily II DNA and RNA helicase [Bifidobacterium bohemicum]